jgi:FkbM family methyltransferase
MLRILKEQTKRLLKRFNLKIGHYDFLTAALEKRLQFDQLKQNFDQQQNAYHLLQQHCDELQHYQHQLQEYIAFLQQLSPKDAFALLSYLLKATSQLGQDLFVLSELQLKHNGFFVEFGATNGLNISNTYLLETEFSWKGILAEPAKCWHEELKKHRNCHIDTHCVWRDSDKTFAFNEVNAIPELSTIHSLSDCDMHHNNRKVGQTYDVTTISFLELLKKHNAPRIIDYLSIDTEGSEFEILSAFDFDQYKFKVITCEHNFTAMREKIYALLTKHGYIRKFEILSKFDDWYVLQEIS